MADPTIHSPQWDAELGATLRLHEIDPGGDVSPYHVHRGNEELLVTGTEAAG